VINVHLMKKSFFFFFYNHACFFFFFSFFFVFFFFFCVCVYRECPDELKEPISSLIYAASRVGDFPELQEIRSILTSRFGKEFAARAIDLRNNCGVNLTVYLHLENFQN
jgi:hypothetical protein